MEKNTPQHLSGDLPGERILQNVPLAPFTTIGIGGPARYFLEANTIRISSSRSPGHEAETFHYSCLEEGATC